jgi:hypothetical protein
VPLSDRPAYQAYLLLYCGFIAAPIIAGADKFLQLLSTWDQYLAPQIPRLTGIQPHTFMLGIGSSRSSRDSSSPSSRRSAV